MNVQELNIYPIKGCRGISLKSAQITPLGIATLNLLLRDRSFVVAKPNNGKFITQRQIGTLALVTVELDPPELLHSPETPKNEDLSNVSMILSAPTMSSPLKISLAALHSLSNKSNSASDITVWAWTGKGYDVGSEAAAWFSELLNTPAKLIAYGGLDKPPKNQFRRDVIWPWAPKGHEVAFADGFPYLLATNASLHDLNNRLESPIPMNRFRPNIIIDGSVPWEEDEWSIISITAASIENNHTTASSDADTMDKKENKILLENVKPCSRCKVPTIDQSTGIAGDEPTKTMYTFRSGEALGWTEPAAFKKAVFFGINMCPGSIDGSRLISVGDVLTVESRMDGPPGTNKEPAVVMSDSEDSDAGGEEKNSTCLIS